MTCERRLVVAGWGWDAASAVKPDRDEFRANRAITKTANAKPASPNQIDSGGRRSMIIAGKYRDQLPVGNPQCNRVRSIVTIKSTLETTKRQKVDLTQA